MPDVASWTPIVTVRIDHGRTKSHSSTHLGKPILGLRPIKKGAGKVAIGEEG